MSQHSLSWCRVSILGLKMMYIPPQFQEVRQSEIERIVARFPLATIICQKEDELIVNHIPLLWTKDASMIGHIALANPLHKLFPDGTDVLVIFQAEDSYISPNWYKTKEVTHKHVPTWNYQVVHMKGRLTFDHTTKAKLSAVGKLTKTHESIHSGDKEWKMSDAPKDYMDDMLANIVAFEFTVTKIIAKSKMSQNRAPEDYNSVAENMKKRQRDFLAQSMISKDK